MLKLENIKKDYYVGENVVSALKGVSLSFRKNEFVSILGPSGCGKTTLLNIIGGLDHYTSGDLHINGRSTKEYKDRDWDVYRNHRIGFIFQSYNLIPHQNVLSNVELALTIAGLSKEERIAKAKKALDRVGLSGQYYKKPNQLSGGQCQRVAIARALVNEPEILLADEPTGALDTVTSVQIMDLIKEISKEKLVIMVTHNPDLALEYSSRIIKLLDGNVLEDSNPFNGVEETKEDSVKVINDTKKKEKAKMSLWTAFKLSARNLLSKKGRTLLTCFAGSIGIIGVSAVLSVSNGVKGYIASMQDDMLSGNPITIQEQALDLDAVMGNMTVAQKAEIIKEADKVNVEFLINQLLEQYEQMGKITVTNNITDDYINYIKNISSDYAACVRLEYGLDMTYSIYTDFYPSRTNENTSKDPVGQSITSIISNYTSTLSHVDGLANYSSFIVNLVECFKQAPNNIEYIESQYNILSGKVATEANEIMIVLDKNSQMTDLILAELGYYTQDEFVDICLEAKENPKSDHAQFKTRFTYDEILGKTFRWYSNDAIFTKNTDITKPMISFNYKNNESMITEDGLELKVVGILEPKQEINYGCLTTGFYYTEALTQYALRKNIESEIVKYIEQQPSKSITSGHIVYKNGDETIEYDQGITYSYNYVFDNVEREAVGYVGSENMISSMMGMMGGTSGSKGTSTYSLSLRQAGGNDLANYIAIYPVNFELKDYVTDYLDAWNGEGDITVGDKVIAKTDREKITYTDSVGLIITMLNTLIDIIAYALIAFTALSLVVSCVMIAIITYVSVMERVKEIGVIRALGGRKKDVSHLFNAETFIIGMASGVFGIGITYLLQLFANMIIGHLSGIYTIADLPITQALTMILLSVVLTCVSGLIPASSAAKKDPVEALRTE